MDLITRSDDERLEKLYEYVRPQLPVGDDYVPSRLSVAVHSLRLALSRAEAAEKDLADARGQACAIKGAWEKFKNERAEVHCCPRPIGYADEFCPECEALSELDSALSSSSPCAHAERVKELEGYSVKWFDRVSLLESRLSALEQERGRLREALERIASGKLTSSGDLVGAEWDELTQVQVVQSAMRLIATAALRATEGK